MRKQSFSELKEGIYAHLLNIMSSMAPALFCCFYIYAIGYTAPLLTRGFAVTIFISFLFGVLQPVPSKNRDILIEDLRNRLINESDANEQAKDVLELMLSNMSEIREYYSISKKQANLAFWLSILFCLFGIIAIAVSLPGIFVSSIESTIITVIAGAISELFATTALFVHKNALKQLNIYYKSLHENEKFLSIVNLTNQLPPDKRVASIEKIIESSLSDISSSLKDINDEQAESDN